MPSNQFVRACWNGHGGDSRGYTVNKSALVERIGDIAAGRNLPPLLDVRDVSTDDVRIALELKKDSDEKMVMAYLFKHTPLRTRFVVNLACPLMPTENAESAGPSASICTRCGTSCTSGSRS